LSVNKFEDLYNQYHAPVVRYVANMVGPSEAPDVTQEVFAKIDKGLDHFEGRAKIATWIYRIATNTAIDWLRSRRKHQLDIPLFSEAAGFPAEDVVVAQTHGPSEQMIATEMNDCIRQQVNKLPEKSKNS